MLHKLRALRTNENILIAVDVLLHSKTAFMNIFLMSFLISVSLDSSPVDFIIYCITRYSLMSVFSLVLMPIMKRHTLATWRTSMFFSIAQILSVIFLDNQASYFVFVIAIFSAFESTLYWRPKMYYDVTEVDNSHRLRFKSTGQIINEAIRIIMPIVLGIIISKSSYIRAGTIILIISIMQLSLSILFQPTGKKMITRPHPYKRVFMDLLQHKSLQKIFLIQLMRGLAFSSAAYVIISQIIVYRSANSDLGLGFLTSVSSLVAISMIVFYRRLRTRTAQKAALLSIIPATILIPFSLLLFPNDIILSMAFYIFTQSAIEGFLNSTILMTRLQQLLNGHISDNAERFEVESISESALAFGRVFGQAILLIIIICNREELMLPLALIESLLIIPIVAMALPAEKRL